jgi:putative ATP-binding cassette transporter
MIAELVRRARFTLLSAVALGLLAGVAGAGLIAVIGRVERDGAAAFGGRALLVFSAALAVRLMAAFCSRLILIRTGQDFVLQLRSSLTRRVLAASLLSVERVSAARITAALSSDVTAIAGFFAAIPTVCVNAAVVFGSLVFIAFLSGPLLVLTVLVIGLGVAVYRPLSQYGTRRFARARRTENALFSYFAELTRGFKELKMDGVKREQAFEPLLARSTAEYRSENSAALNAYALVDAWSGFVFFLALGAAIFPPLSVLHASPARAGAYVLAMMFLVGPLHSVVGLLPVASSAVVAARALEALCKELSPQAPLSLRERTPPLIEKGWRRLCLENVEFSYEGEEGFGVGPVSLCLQPGEIVFITGGNGSGKSTFLRLLAGLYSPHGGRIQLDGVPVEPSTEQSYRDSFSAIFSDFCLFPQLPVAAGAGLEQRAREYLKQLRLDRLVHLEDGRFSRVDLSTGQRKRLAMVSALLEERPLVLLDEWAAEQDAETRAYFYETLLPSLRERGVTVVAVTHDDRFFDCADRVLRFEYGAAHEEPRRAVAPANTGNFSVAVLRSNS